jgi:hypothetical protein
MKQIFPRHDIDPAKKDSKWILQYVKAAYEESRGVGRNFFYHGRENLRKLIDYSNGNQSITPYQTRFEPKDANDRTERFIQLDYTIVPFIPKFKKIALGKLNKVKYNITAKAIDSLARDQEESYFAEQKAKIDLMDQLGDIPNIAQMLGMEEGEPQSLEELRIKREFSYKHQAAIEVEHGLKLVFDNNKYEQIEERIKEDIFNFGYAIVKEYFDENGKIKVRHVKPYAFACSYSEEYDFSDAKYRYEVLPKTAEDVRREGGFNEEEMAQIVEKSKTRGRWEESAYQRPSRPWDDDKINVVDIEFDSINTKVFEKRVNSAGNLDVRKADFWKKDKGEKYESAEYKVIYKAKWIIGTDFIYDYGLETDMKRAKNSLRDTQSSFHAFAPSQDQMRFFGVVESMIPVADQIQIAWLKLQNLILNIVPPGIAFDLSALDNVNLGSAGEKWKPLKILELYRQRGDFPYRSRTEDGEPFANVPIQNIQSQVMGEVNQLVGLINGYMQLLRDNIGFNEVTDGSTPDPRMLNGVANIALQSTSNALYHITKAAKHINESVASGLCIRMQDAFAKGMKPYMTSLGVNTQRFWQTLADISVHELSIKLEDLPSDEEKQNYIADMQIALQAGQITIADKVYLDTIDNLKERSAVLAYFVKKNKQIEQQNQQMLIQENGKVQQQSALMAEQAKQQTMQLDYQLKTQYMLTESQEKQKLKAMELQARYAEGTQREEGRIITKQVENQGKQVVKQMEQNSNNS